VSSKKIARDWLLYVEDMLDSIKTINEFLKETSKDHFLNNRMMKDAVIRNFEIIGEATRHIPLENRKKHPEIPWETLYDTRNELIHEYFEVDFGAIWADTKNSLPEIEKKLEALMQKLQPKTNS